MLDLKILYILDIYTPSKIKNDLPVMFWIHGGGNTSGLKRSHMTFQRWYQNMM